MCVRVRAVAVGAGGKDAGRSVAVVSRILAHHDHGLGYDDCCSRWLAPSWVYLPLHTLTSKFRNSASFWGKMYKTFLRCLYIRKKSAIENFNDDKLYILLKIRCNTYNAWVTDYIYETGKTLLETHTSPHMFSYNTPTYSAPRRWRC